MGLFQKKDKTKKPEQKKKAPPPKTAKKNDLGITVSEEDGHNCAYMAMVLENTGRKRAMRFLSVSLVFNMILLLAFVFVFWWGVMYKRNIYFATTPDGRIQELVPLSEPYISIAGVSNWTAQAVTETYSLDFRNYKRSLAKVRKYYSVNAWREIDSQIRPLIDSVVKERLILYAVADEAPRLLAEGMYKDMRYCWKLEFPLTLTHQLAQGTQTFRWLVQVLVGRANVAEKPEGLEILQFVIMPRR